MNNQTQNTNIAQLNVLPQDQSKALNMLIRLTQNLSNLADREAQALAQNDMLTFAILQDEKALVTEQYMHASEEFRSNLNFYRGAESNLLDRLERLQIDLGEKTKDNNKVVNQIHSRAQTKTQNALLTVQELGQEHKIQFEKTEDEGENAPMKKQAGV